MNKSNLKNVALITTSRADYSILRNLIFLFKYSKKINFKLVLTGQHLANKYGNTFKEIESDYGRKNLIKRCLNNLIDNAISFSKNIKVKHQKIKKSVLIFISNN